jgi:hypothetical protein
MKLNQELIDLLRGELAPEEERALRDRMAREPALAGELKELENLFGLMRRLTEEVEVPARIRERVMAAARRAAAPSILQQVAALPALVRYRFRQSVVFRVAVVSLTAHLLLMAVLFQFTVPQRPDTDGPDIGVHGQLPHVRPDAAVVRRFTHRRLPHAVPLGLVGIEEQGAFIRAGLDVLLERQHRDGSFGDARETALATLALLAEGDSSTFGARSHEIELGIRRIMADAREGAAHGAMLTALVENFILSYDLLTQPERDELVAHIVKLIEAVGDDEEAAEGLALAKMAGFRIGERPLGEAAHLLNGARHELLARKPTRLRATAVLARGQEMPDRERVRSWVRPLFDRAREAVEAGNDMAVAVLTLQAPYRL